MTRVVLQNALTPVLYALTLEPDLERFTFQGQLEIHVSVATPTCCFLLHARELAIHSASYIPSSTASAASSDTRIDASKLNVNVQEHVLEIIFAKELPIGEGIVRISYTGQLNNQMAGFYRSSYNNINGEKKIMASTQFEPLDARRALPCVDEPAVKVGP